MTSSCSGRVPIFVISFNRLADLVRSIQSYESLDTPVDVIIHDNGSTLPELRDYLAEQERAGRMVTFNAPLKSVDSLNSVNSSIEQYFGCPIPPRPFVVTDPDISLECARNDVLDVYNCLLGQSNVACVGPMLTITDIPLSYPLRDHAIQRHVDQFWHKYPETIRTPYGIVAYQYSAIDTTFALHRAGRRFARMSWAMRVYHPFEAKHLTWYRPIPPDLTSYYGYAEGVSHWAAREYVRRNQYSGRAPQQIYVVRGSVGRDLSIERTML